MKPFYCNAAIRILSGCIFLLLLFQPYYANAKNIENIVPRLAGTNRYETAVEIALIGWPLGTNSVILARSDNIADALAGIPLAFKLDAPLLLTNTNTIPIETKKALSQLDPKYIYILGGTGAISESVEQELESCYSIIRIAGKSRYDTAAKIAELVSPKITDTVVIVNGDNWPDALAVAPIAASNGFPILLNGSDYLHSITRDTLTLLAPEKVIIVGGTRAISNLVEEELIGYNTIRVAGSTRYDTAIELIKFFSPCLKTVFFASGLEKSQGVDAIAGAALAAKNKVSLLLVGDTLPETVSQFMDSAHLYDAIIFGGTGAISKFTEQQIYNALSIPNYALENSWPKKGAVDFYPKYGYLTLYFSTDMANPDTNMINNILLLDNTGNKIPINKAEIGQTAKNAVLIVPAEQLELKTRYKLFIPAEILVSFDEIRYPKTIIVDFETAHTVIRGSIQNPPEIQDEDISLLLNGTNGSYKTLINQDGVFLLTNIEAGEYVLDIFYSNRKLYSQRINVMKGYVHRPEIVLN